MAQADGAGGADGVVSDSPDLIKEFEGGFCFGKGCVSSYGGSSPDCAVGAFLVVDVGELV